MVSLPRLLGLPHAIVPRRRGLSLWSHFGALGTDAMMALAQFVLTVVFLADQAWRMVDATLGTAYRLAVSRRYLLEWLTAAQAGAAGRPGIAGQFRFMAAGVALALAMALAIFMINPAVWPLVVPFALIWALAPLVAERISRPHHARGTADLAPADVMALRLIARRTWRYFDTFVTESDQFLPPDNFQEIPRPVVAHRTSPTNIGLYLLSVVAAREMGWLSEAAATRRLHDTLTTMGMMARFRGHFYNWYETTDLRVLDPVYVSSVDSGNPAGHLIAVAQSCRDWAG